MAVSCTAPSVLCRRTALSLTTGWLCQRLTQFETNYYVLERERHKLYLLCFMVPTSVEYTKRCRPHVPLIAKAAKAMAKPGGLARPQKACDSQPWQNKQTTPMAWPTTRALAYAKEESAFRAFALATVEDKWINLATKQTIQTWI